MANFTASALTAAQTKYSKQFNSAELRRKQNPALMLGLGNSGALITDIQELKKKDTMPVKAYLKKKRAAAATNAKSATHLGTKSDSAEIQLAFITIVEPFTVHLKQAQGNIFAYADMLQHELEQSAANIHDRAGTLALAFLQSNRTQLAGIATGGAGAWSNANGALEIALADKDNFFQNLTSFMRLRNYRGRYDVIADSRQYRKAQYIQNQGGGNQTNLAWQVGDCDIVETTEAIDANYTNGSALAMMKGTFGALTWNDPQNVKGKGDYDSTLGGYGTVLDPLGSGEVLDFHAYTERADGSAAGGGVQDEKLEGEVSLTLAWVLQPITTANESVVYEIAQMAV